MIALNVETINSFCSPHLVEVSDFRMLSVCFALVMVTFICCENVSFGSRVIPRIFGCFVGNVWLFNLSDRVGLYSAGSGVKIVVVILSYVYMKIISGGPFIYFVEIWLNKLLSLMVFGVICSDYYVISICCDWYVFWGK